MYPPPDLTALLHTGLLPDVAVLLRLAAALAELDRGERARATLARLRDGR